MHCKSDSVNLQVAKDHSMGLHEAFENISNQQFVNNVF